jgi:hypothetical protein
VHTQARNRAVLWRCLGYVAVSVGSIGLTVAANHAMTWCASVVPRPVVLVGAVLGFLLSVACLHMTYRFSSSLARFSLVLASGLMWWCALVSTNAESAEWLGLLGALLIILATTVDYTVINRRQPHRPQAERPSS